MLTRAHSKPGWSGREGKQENGVIAVAVLKDTINSVLFSSDCVEVNTDLLSIVYNLFIPKSDMHKTDSCPSTY